MDCRKKDIKMCIRLGGWDIWNIKKIWLDVVEDDLDELWVLQDRNKWKEIVLEVMVIKENTTKKSSSTMDDTTWFMIITWHKNCDANELIFILYILDVFSCLNKTKLISNNSKHIYFIIFDDKSKQFIELNWDGRFCQN